MAARWEQPPAAAAVTLLLSLGASAPGLLRGASAGRSAASLRPAALRAGEVHRLVTYIFVYEDLVSLACGAIIIWYFASSFEKNVGTVKHCFLTIAFAILSALLFLLLEALVSQVSEVADAKGFMPVAFAMLGVSATRSRMKRALVLGVRVPVVLLPWLLLCTAWLIPHSSLLSNLSGLLAGEAYGLGYCSCLDFPESVGSKLDQLFPFCLLKRVPGLSYVPGSAAERRAAASSRAAGGARRAEGPEPLVLRDAPQPLTAGAPGPVSARLQDPWCKVTPQIAGCGASVGAAGFGEGGCPWRFLRRADPQRKQLVDLCTEQILLGPDSLLQPR
ncbi:rhomboid domain-containing protein 2 [Porphyrio hochstetteri]